VTFVDVSGNARTGSQRLVNLQTFADGCLLRDPGGADSVPWVERISPEVSHG
jgi:hypothetical protein